MTFLVQVPDEDHSFSKLPFTKVRSSTEEDIILPKKTGKHRRAQSMSKDAKYFPDHGVHVRRHDVHGDSNHSRNLLLKLDQQVVSSSITQ